MKSYLVGGAVRDMLLGLDPSDRDYVVVGATEAQLLAEGYQRVGASFPVFFHPVTGDEYAMARREVKTGSGYTGFDVEFSPDVTLEEDLGRRDLTINAMAMAGTTLVDPYNGRLDLTDGPLLRHVSNAFAEDPLRVVRLARFYARYPESRVAQETWTLACRVVDSGEMDSIPAERYVAEFRKVLESRVAHDSCMTRFLTMLFTFGVFDRVEFFKKTFSKRTKADVDRMGLVADHLATQGFNDEFVLMGLLAVGCTDPQQTKMFGSRVSDAFGPIMSLQQFDTNPRPGMAEELVGLLRKHRSLTTMSTGLSDATVVHRLMWEAGVPMTQPEAVLPLVVLIAATTSAEVDSQYYVDRFEGKELGEQLFAARVRAVQRKFGEFQ